MALFVFFVVRNFLHQRRSNHLIEGQKEEIQNQVEELKKATNKLVELDNYKQNMTGIIVHDLKNSLIEIINISKLHSLEKQRQRMKQIEKQMLNMVFNILDVYKYEENKMRLDYLDFSLYENSLDAINDVNFLAEQKEIEIINRILPETNIKADKEITKLIFVNLITLGIKHSQQHEKIHISCFRDPEGFIQIEISYTGEGIPQEKIKEVFAKFGQIQVKGSGGVRSMRLGLTFCKLAVETHGGKIGVKSKKPKGTTIFFTLPEGKKTDQLLNLPQLDSQIIKEEIIQLTSADGDTLKVHEAELKHLVVSETLKIGKILSKIDYTKSESLQQWVTELKVAIFSMDVIKYNNLINQINKEKTNEKL